MGTGQGWPLGWLLSWALLCCASAPGQAQSSPPSAPAQPSAPPGPPSPPADAKRSASPTGGAPKDPDSPPTSGWTALPVASYSPETALGLGGFAAYFFRLGDLEPAVAAESRPSSVAAVALVTTRQQVILEFIPELYWDHDRYRLWSKVDYRHYPNSFWGIGPRTPDSAREWYTEDGPRAQVQLRRQVAGHLYLEGRVDAHFARMKDTETQGLLDSGSVTGANASRLVGVGPAVGWDSRDHILAPHRGGLYELSILQFHRALLSQFTFSRMELNLRRYLAITSTHTLALQVYGELAFGLVPFHRLPMLGGQRLLRGYFEGRYRDRAMLLAQAEYRMPLFWRIGLVGFVGLGEVAESMTRFGFSPFKWSLGGGLRFMLSEAEKLNLRVDVGFGHRTWGLYVGIAEAF